MSGDILCKFWKAGGLFLYGRESVWRNRHGFGCECDERQYDELYDSERAE